MTLEILLLNFQTTLCAQCDVCLPFLLILGAVCAFKTQSVYLSHGGKWSLDVERLTFASSLCQTHPLPAADTRLSFLVLNIGFCRGRKRAKLNNRGREIEFS